MVLPGEPVFIVKPPQVFGEGVRVYQLTMFVREEVVTEWEATVQSLLLLVIAIGTENVHHILAHINCPGAAVLGRTFHNAFAWNHAAGAADRQNALVAVYDEVRPLQSAQLTPAAAGVDCQGVKGFVGIVNVCDDVQKFLGFFVGRNGLGFLCSVRQVDHPGGILLDDLVSLSIAQDGGDHRQIFLNGGFLERFAPERPLAKLHQQILQRDWPQPVEFDAADVGIHLFQRPAIESESAGSVFRLPVQPAGGVFLKGHLAVLAVAGLDDSFEFLGLVSNVLLDAAAVDAVRNCNRFCPADFSAIRAVTVTDGDLVFSCIDFLDACHKISFLNSPSYLGSGCGYRDSTSVLAPVFSTPLGGAACYPSRLAVRGAAAGPRPAPAASPAGAGSD